MCTISWYETNCKRSLCTFCRQLFINFHQTVGSGGCWTVLGWVKTPTIHKLDRWTSQQSQPLTHLGGEHQVLIDQVPSGSSHWQLSRLSPQNVLVSLIFGTPGYAGPILKVGMRSCYHSGDNVQQQYMNDIYSCLTTRAAFQACHFGGTAYDFPKAQNCIGCYEGLSHWRWLVVAGAQSWDANIQ